MTTPPPTWSLRAATTEDIPAIVDVINAASVAEGGQADSTIEEIRDEWRDPHFDPATDAWVAIDESGAIVGHQSAFDFQRADHATIDGYVAPSATGRGIGQAMVRAAEARVIEAVAKPVIEIHSTVGGRNDRGHTLFEGEGYRLVRQFLRMEIEHHAPPATPDWPEGISARSFVRGQDEAATHAAVTEAMSDHWGSAPVPLDEWLRTRIEVDTFDPSLWLLAFEGDTVAGVALCRKRPDIAWVNTLAVRRAWRGRGLGMALLHHAFATFYDRGEHRVGLGVDSQSLTGATRLYERAGMRTTERYDTFGKTIER